MNVLVFVCFFNFILLAQVLISSAYMASTGEDAPPAVDDYGDVARILYYARKRSCIKRGSSCDHRPNDCCTNSSCRCNLWGTNCRCQRMGLFQKWGKK